MKEKEQGVHMNARPESEMKELDTAKLHKEKDLCKILSYFRYKEGGATTRMAMFDTGILRRSICWYVAYLEEIGELRAIRRDRDPYSNNMAKFYSADKSTWKQERHQQLSLFNDLEG